MAGHPYNSVALPRSLSCSNVTNILYSAVFVKNKEINVVLFYQFYAGLLKSCHVKPRPSALGMHEAY